MSRRAGFVLVLLSLVPSLLMAGAGRWLAKGCFSRLKLQERQRLQLAVQGYLEQEARRIRQALTSLVAGEKIDRLLVEIAHQQVEASRMTFLARQWAQEYGLEVLLIADGSGMILSCANLPARAGEADESLRHLAERESEADFVLPQPLLYEGTVTQKLAWLSFKRRAFENTVLVFLAGFFIDQSWLEGLKKISGALRIDLLDQQSAPLQAMEEVSVVDLPSPPLEDSARIRLAITPEDTAGQEEALLVKLYLLAVVCWVPVLMLVVFSISSKNFSGGKRVL
jgi:hypothetical protein